MVLTVRIKHDLPLNNRLIPDGFNETDESYNLYVTSPQNVTLDAFQWSGAVRGLGTLAQLIKPANGSYNLSFAPMTLVDWPRFHYRGFMLDTARRFYPVDSILRLMDSMAVAKFNVFHWHMVEDESFPIELKIFPAMWKNGAFKEGETYSRA